MLKSPNCPSKIEREIKTIECMLSALLSASGFWHIRHVLRACIILICRGSPESIASMYDADDAMASCALHMAWVAMV